MTRFAATTLDLSRLPPPDVLKDLDYEAIFQDRIADLANRLTEAGIDYDVGQLETDPLAILQQADGYRELLDKQAINDAAKAVLVPYSWAGNLEALGAFFGVARLDGETDNQLRRRIQLAPEAYSSAGTAGAYLFHALSASPTVKDAGLSVPIPGAVDVAVLSREGDGTATPELVDLVRARLFDDAIKPLTDMLQVMAAEILPYTIDVRLRIRPGPEAAIVRGHAELALQELAAERHRCGMDIHISAIVAAAHVGNVRQVVINGPVEDLVVGPLQAAWCTEISVSSEVIDD